MIAAASPSTNPRKRGAPSPGPSITCSMGGAPQMPDSSQANDVASYASAVRAALAPLLDAERESLLEDLENHLAEVASESDLSLQERLGPPEDYAAGLSSASTSRSHCWRCPSLRAWAPVTTTAIRTTIRRSRISPRLRPATTPASPTSIPTQRMESPSKMSCSMTRMAGP